MSKIIQVNVLTFFCAALWTLIGCGSDSDSSKNAEISAPVIESSSSRGFVFAAISTDQSSGQSSVFRYDFKKGKITKILQGESANPALFLDGSKVLLINRHNSLKNFKYFDPFSEDDIDPKGFEHALTTGDPLDAVSIGSGTFLLANPLGQKVQTLNTNTGLIATPYSNLFAPKVFRPLRFVNTQEAIYILHSGLELSADGIGSNDGTQQVFSSSLTGITLNFRDADPTTEQIDGSPLTATLPIFALKKSLDSFQVLGLCSKQIQNCKAGADSVVKGKATKLAQFTKDAAGYVDQIQPSEKEAQLWALVSNSQDMYVVASINTSTGTITEELHRFEQKRLFGIAFDPESKTLFVGDTDGEKGKLLLFREKEKLASIDLDGVFYRGVLVP